MLSRLATVLQELSGEEGTDGDSQGVLEPQLPASEGHAPSESEVPEEAMERLAHLEQLVVQLKELIRDKDTRLLQKDTELANKDAKLKSESEAAEARFTKLKLQAKAKMASLNKQINELKGHEGAASPDSSFTGAGGALEEELQELRSKLSEEEANSKSLKEQLQATEQLLQDKESAHAEQVRILQAVVCEKDVRFQEQIQKHEEELLRVTTQSQNNSELQQAFHTAQRRCEELEEAVNSRSEVLEMLQQEVNSADQQKQILTAQFRQMEQELAESVRLREEERQQRTEQVNKAEAEISTLRNMLEAWEAEKAEMARLQTELAALKDTELVSQEALQKEKMEVARLERELALLKEVEVAATQASQEALAEIERVERELESIREADSDRQSALEIEKSEMEKLSGELAALRAENEELQEKGIVLNEVWRHLRSLAFEDLSAVEDSPVSIDSSMLMGTVQSIETQLSKLKEEHNESEKRCMELGLNIDILQEQLNKRTKAEEEATSKIQQMSDGSSVAQSAQDVETYKAHIFGLEQKLLEKDNELSALKESFVGQKHESIETTGDHSLSLGQVHEDSAVPHNASALHDLLEETQGETTLVADDASVLSVSADNGSSPELIGTHSESAEESKATSSDEMVASSDSEVAHSSWTLLEAVNQEGGQEWPSIFNQVQSWETTSIEQEASTDQAESSPSVIIQETVQVHLTEQRSSLDIVSSGQAFAEELQKKNSALLSELQRLREEAAESQEKIRTLKEETQSLIAAKEAAESQTLHFEEELKTVRRELDYISQQSSAVKEKQSVDMQLLEEQIDILNSECAEKEEKIQALQTELEIALVTLSEQQGQARMLSVQLEDRELFSSELEQKLRVLESSMLETSQSNQLNNDSLLKKDSEISELQLRLTKKEKEIVALNDSISAKLHQAEEERFLIDGEMNKLKEELQDLKNVVNEKESSSNAPAAPGEEILATLQREKEELQTQLTNTKKKLQVALVQRKELMKKVADFKEKGNTDQDTTDEQEIDKSQNKEFEEMEARLAELKQALKSKEEAVESLEQKISQKDQFLAEILALNRKLGEEAEHSQQTVSSPETAVLQSQVASLETECEALHRKVLDAQESRKDTIRKAKEKDRHHREQLKQQKEEYSVLLGRFEMQSSEREVLLTKLSELEMGKEQEGQSHQEMQHVVETLEKTAASDWVQEDWVEFATSDPDTAQQPPSDQISPCAEQTERFSTQVHESVDALREEIFTLQKANAELEKKMEETHAILSLKETTLLKLGNDLQQLREKEMQIDVLSEEMNDLREKYHQAQSYAESLKAEMDTAVRTASVESATSMAALQAEVADFKLFLDNKNQEIMELSQQLNEQNTLIRSMEKAVSHKDELIVSLQEELTAVQEKAHKLEVEVPQKQEEEKDSETKIQQLQRKLQAALISRKEVLKENKTLKEQLASTEQLLADLKEKMGVTEQEMEKVNGERERLISEVDRLLLENQSLGSSCESLKLAMEGISSEKDTCRREADLAKEEAGRACREWEEKVQAMKDEYETLLKSYENVSDEAERVRRVLEAARQERQELASKVRSHEAARQEAERQAEEAQKEVDLVKDKMRKFAKTKQQKILELEEENERLREQQEKSLDASPEDRGCKTELERVREELRALQSELEATAAERDSLGQHIDELKEQLAQKEEKETSLTQSMPPSTAAVPEEIVTAQKSDVIMTKAEPTESQYEGNENVIYQQQTSDVSKKITLEEGLTPTEEKAVISQIENKMKEMEDAVNAEKDQWQQREADFKAQLSALEQHLKESKDKETALEQSLHESQEKEKSLVEESVKKEIQFEELLRNLETEKDNLEERLMNQLAQLNGSIASYQQEAADNQQQLAELRHEVETLERERAELEAQAQSEKERAARLEEEMRQAQRQRAEAEAQSGKQRELQQQLRSAERVKEGSQSRARQLEELLREKQLEVRQLQKDSIKYQERISELGREAKTLHISHDELHKKQQQSQLEISKFLDDLARTEAELSLCKSQLHDAEKLLKEALVDKTAVEEKAQQKEALIKAEAEQTLDSVRFRLGAELKDMELRLEEAYREREKEEEATVEAKEMAEAAERRVQKVQARLDESLARLAAFSRCMSSLQDDRDRILDEARQWEGRFNSSLQGKEAEVRGAETRVKALTEQLQKECALKEELEVSIDRLEKENKEWQQKLEEIKNKFTESEAALEEEKSNLQKTTAALQVAQTEVYNLSNEMESMHQRARALEEAVGQLQAEVDQARAELTEREAEERRLCLNVEQLEADLRSSKALTENLQTELNEKETKEVHMLEEKEEAIAQAAEEARREADSRAQEAEKELEQRRGQLQDLEEKLRKAVEECNQSKARLDSFVKAMGSLQEDRDRVLNMYKQLEEKHLQVMMEKDGLIQEAAGENNSLKEELRSLLVQRDDLYAEKAKLAAQLHGYREELNQVLSMKESQHKRLLAAHQKRIASLEKERKEMENQLKSVSVARDSEGESRLERETLSQAHDTKTQIHFDAPGAEVEKLREQLQAARKQVSDLEDTLHRERQEQESKSKELEELKWEGGVMRTESESAQERVAELAQDLLAVEQKLLEEKEVTTRLRAEHQSFAKAMASLQDSRDQALNKAQELSLKVEELSKAHSHTAQSGPAGSAGEVWGLKNALQALQNDRERLLEQLQTQSTELKKQKSELSRLGAGELIKVSQELSEEKKKNIDMLEVVAQLENVIKVGKQEIETLRMERVDMMAQAEQLKQQTLATLSERDQQLRQLTAMLEEVQTQKPKLQQEHYQRQGTEEVDSAPGAPQQKSSARETHAYLEEVKELQRRLDEEMQQRLAAEEQLLATQDRLSRHSQAKWHSTLEGSDSETAVFIEPPEGAVTRTRRVGPGLLRILRVAFCSRQRTPLLFILYLLTVHVLLLLCLGGYL